MLRGLEGWHLIILLAVVVLLFGGKKLPEAARGLGRSLRIFKSEVKELHEDDKGTEGRSGAVEGRIVGSDQQVPPAAGAQHTAPPAAPPAEPGQQPAPSAQKHDA